MAYWHLKRSWTSGCNPNYCVRHYSLCLPWRRKGWYIQFTTHLMVSLSIRIPVGVVAEQWIAQPYYLCICSASHFRGEYHQTDGSQRDCGTNWVCYWPLSPSSFSNRASICETAYVHVFTHALRQDGWRFDGQAVAYSPYFCYYRQWTKDFALPFCQANFITEK